MHRLFQLSVLFCEDRTQVQEHPPILDAADDRGGIVAGHFVERPDADQLLGIRLQPLQKALAWRGSGLPQCASWRSVTRTIMRA